MIKVTLKKILNCSTQLFASQNHLRREKLQMPLERHQCTENWRLNGQTKNNVYKTRMSKLFETRSERAIKCSTS